MYTYSQSTGQFLDDGQLMTCGYSGCGEGENNPAMQDVKNVGPIPVGQYKMVALIFHDDRLGPRVIRLEPYPGNKMFDRDGFYIHGDSIENPGNASDGCIVLGRAIRNHIFMGRCRELTVVP
jgi:Protein of unknown function (DUF2778)